MDVISYLQEHGVPHQVLTHSKPVFTTDEAARERGLHISQATKCMVCKSKKYGVICFLIPGHKNLDFRKARQYLNERKMSFVPAETLEQEYGLTIGAISPVQMIGQARFICDQSITENETLAISAGFPGKGVSLRSQDLVSLLNADLADIG